MKKILSKFISRRIALSIGGVSTVVTAAMEDGVVTENEFWGIVIAVTMAIVGFSAVDAVEKGKENEKA